MQRIQKRHSIAPRSGGSKRGKHGKHPPEHESDGVMKMEILTPTFTPMVYPDVETLTSTKKKSHILSITEKITKTLHDFDDLLGSGRHEDHLNDISLQVDNLQSSPFKHQLKSFISNYKDVAAHAEEIHQERNEILESLSDWFSSHHLDQYDTMLTPEVADFDQQTKVVSENLVETKMGFDKLKKLNDLIGEKRKIGRETDHLEVEKKLLQKSVIKKFKSYKSAKEKVKIQSKEDKDVWKHAASEICGLLNKVRDQGADYIAELETKMNAFIKQTTEQQEQIMRLEANLTEKRLMEEKYRQENLELIEEKARLLAQAKKFKKRLKDIKMGRVQGTGALENEELGVEETTARDIKQPGVEETQPIVHTTARHSIIDDKAGFIVKAQLRDAKKQLANANLEKSELKSRIDELERALEAKEDDIMQLEHDKVELLHQMKHANVRADTRRLSDSKPAVIREDVPSSNFAGSIHGMHIDTLEIKRSSVLNARVLCSRCEGSLEMSKSSSHSVSNTDQPYPLDDIVQQKEQEIGKLKKSVNSYKAKVSALVEELKQTQESVVENQNEPQHKEDVGLQVAVIPCTKDTANIEPVEDENRQEKQIVIYQDVTNQGTQTDLFEPDPLVDLSSRRQKLPSAVRPESRPSTIFQGTIPPKTPGRPRESTIGISMLSVKEPEEIKTEAVNVVNDMEKELARMTASIGNFMGYTHQILDREATHMHSANQRLRQQLTANEREDLNETLRRPHTSSLKSGESQQLFPTSPAGVDYLNIEQTRSGVFSAPSARNLLTGNYGVVKYEQSLPMEDRVKIQLAQRGQQAIDSLKDTYNLIFGTFDAEQREYDAIYNMINKRDHIKHEQAIQLHIDKETLSAQKRKSSNILTIHKDEEKRETNIHDHRRSSNVLSVRRDEKERITNIHVEVSKYNLTPKPSDRLHARSQSAIWRHESGLSMETLAKSEPPPVQSIFKEAFDLSMAVVNDDGLIEFGRRKKTPQKDQIMQKKTIAPVFDMRQEVQPRKPTKPAPISRQKLKQKQNLLLKKSRPAGHLADFQLPRSFQNSTRNNRVNSQISPGIDPASPLLGQNRTLPPLLERTRRRTIDNLFKYI